MIRLAFALICVAFAGAAAQPEAVRKEEIRDLLDRLDGAVRRRDRTAIERMYAPEFEFALGNTGVVSRQQQIDGLMVLDPTKSTLGLTPLEGLKFFGDVAQLRIRTATSFSVTTFVKRAGRWQILLTQTNLIPQPAAPQKAAPPPAKKP